MVILRGNITSKFHSMDNVNGYFGTQSSIVSLNRRLVFICIRSEVFLLTYEITKPNICTAGWCSWLSRLLNTQKVLGSNPRLVNGLIRVIYFILFLFFPIFFSLPDKS
jgi:hypothetical protein